MNKDIPAEPSASDLTEDSMDDISPWEALVNRMEAAAADSSNCRDNTGSCKDSTDREKVEILAEHISILDTALGEFKRDFSKTAGKLLYEELPVVFHGLEVANKITDEAARNAMTSLSLQKKYLCESLSQLSVIIKDSRDGNVEMSSTEMLNFINGINSRLFEAYEISKDVFVMQEFQDIVSQVIERTVARMFDIEYVLSNLIRELGLTAEEIPAGREDNTYIFDQINTSLDSTESQKEVDNLLKELGGV